jgi:hypothetical protein
VCVTDYVRTIIIKSAFIGVVSEIFLEKLGLSSKVETFGAFLS